MRTIALIARGELTYQGRRVMRGQVFQASPVEAAVLRYQRKVDFAPRDGLASPASQDPPAAGPPAEPRAKDPQEVDDLPPRRRRYRRRDLVPED